MSLSARGGADDIELGHFVRVCWDVCLGEGQAVGDRNALPGLCEGEGCKL